MSSCPSGSMLMRDIPAPSMKYTCPLMPLLLAPGWTMILPPSPDTAYPPVIVTSPPMQSKQPLLVEGPADMRTWPPVAAIEFSAAPPMTDMSPPRELLEEESPAVIPTEPPDAVLPRPTASCTEPPWPAAASPVFTVMDPVVPALDVPDRNSNAPLTPLTPALGVEKMTDPLERCVLYPAVTHMSPPRATLVVAPATSANVPPLELPPPWPTATTMSPPAPPAACPV